MAYTDCRFCGGRGCLACEGEKQKHAPQSIEPAFIIREDHPEDWNLIIPILHRDAITKEIEQGGDWQVRIQQKLLMAKLAQFHHSQEDDSHSDLATRYADGTINLNEEKENNNVPPTQDR